MKKLEEQSKEKGLKTIHPIILDVTNQTQVDESVKTIENFVSKSKLEFVGLVNNAGLSGIYPAEFLDMDYTKVNYLKKTKSKIK